MIDLSTPLGVRATERLEADLVVWLTTVSPTQKPQPNPVWFLWTGADVLVATPPDSYKVRNLRLNPAVTLSFTSDRYGGDVQVITGSAVVEPEPLAGDELAAFDVKYGEHITSLGMTSAQFHAQYSQVLRIRPERLRGL